MGSRARFLMGFRLPLPIRCRGTGSGSGKRHAVTIGFSPGARKPATVLAAVKDRPFGWPHC